jgi:tRNA threonylcarbamoyladenosine biosynthesis protein TsaB
MSEAGLSLQALDAIAYGRGPGAFTGVRIAIGVVQGLAFGADVVTVGISDLAAVAQQVAVADAQILVCMDARMQEVYWSRFEVPADGLVRSIAAERVGRPESVSAGTDTHCAGTGFAAYSVLTAQTGAAVVAGNVLPHAREIARLAEPELRAGRGQPAAAAQPTYLRDTVTFVKRM